MMHPDMVGPYDEKVDALLEAYRTGTPEAMERHWRLTWHRRSWQGMRGYVQADLGLDSGDDVAITRDDARWLVAREHGFPSWSALLADVQRGDPGGTRTLKPMATIARHTADEDTTARASREWAVTLEQLRQPDVIGFDARGQLTDAMLRDVATLPHLEVLRLGGCGAVSDAGLQLLRAMPMLRELDLSQTGVTDAGVPVLASLPALTRVSLAWTAVSDAGAVALAACTGLQSVNLMGSGCGDGTIAALSGLGALHELCTGARTTDAALPLLHGIPSFATWRGTQPDLALLRPTQSPTRLQLRGAITDRGVQALRGLDGLFCLDLDDSAMGLTAAALEPLLALPQLGMLWFDANDESMPLVARLPQLRSFVCQDTAASDAGWRALAASTSIEQIWGRRCHGLGSEGFRALSTMPALRGLSVSCLNVDDAALSALPSFPSLRELMPMDVPDAGYRHIGACGALEALLLMYCRDTTDAATAQVTGLPRLRRYFASYTRITDRTPELLSGVSSLEEVTFDSCARLTDAGIAALARLPGLRALRVSGRGITPEVVTAFAPPVRVHVGCEGFW